MAWSSRVRPRDMSVREGGGMCGRCAYRLDARVCAGQPGPARRLPLTLARCAVYLAPMLRPIAALLQSTPRPRTITGWREHGFDYLLDVGLDVAGVILGALVLWMAVRFIAQRI